MKSFRNLRGLRLLGVLLAGFAANTATSQDGAAGKLPTWDVISVKLNKAQDGPVMMRYTPDGYHAQGVPLRFIAAQAYGVRSDLISGIPGPIDAMAFDIDAKLAAEDVTLLATLSEEQRRELVKTVLFTRFGWKAHLETKELSVYELVVAKGGPKLEPAALSVSATGAPNAKPGTGMMTMQPGVLTGKRMTMTQLANGLAAEVQRNVIDKTGLLGSYDVTLKFTSQRFSHAEGEDNGSTDEEASVFTALTEQLGLKLQPAKGPVKTVVVDQVGIPSEN